MAGRDSTGRTRASLLLRVQDPQDRDSWNEFVSIYTPKIYLWATRLGLQEADAEDATQVVLIKLVQSLRKFKYDRSRGAFRGWLKTVSQNAVRDLFREMKGAAILQWRLLIHNFCCVQTKRRTLVVSALLV